MIKELSESKLSNNIFWRNISDKLDHSMGWQGAQRFKSRFRRLLHGSYHLMIGVLKLCFFNIKGAGYEF